MSQRQVTRQELAARMIRSRNWHLMEAARRRNDGERMRAEEQRHDTVAAELDRQIRALDFDPQPPRGPRAA